MTGAFDFSEHKAAAFAPEMTLDMYKAFPEDASKQIEVVDGWMVRCESAEPSHQAIQFNLLAALRDAVKPMDRRKEMCHRVLGDLDVLISDSPKLHFAARTWWSTAVLTLTGENGDASRTPPVA